MSSDEELRKDQDDDRREIAYVRERLPQEAREKYTDEQLQWMLDTIVEYYVESEVFDSDDEEVDIDLEQVADYVCQQARKEKKAFDLDPQEVYFVVDADLDFQEQDA